MTATAPQPAVASDVAAYVVDARKTYGEGDAAVHALDGVSISFERGRFTAVMGPSGSGKSTLVQCLAGLDRLTSGAAVIGDQELGRLSDDDLTRLRRDRIGFVFQQYNLMPTMSAQDNILLPLTLAKRAPDAAWFDQVVATVGLTDRLHHMPAELSGGQQQRVAIARALVGRPELVIGDEPTGALDSVTGTEILQFLRRAVDELGNTVIMVTHDPHAAAYADLVVFLADGRIVDGMREPTAERVLDRMKAFGS